MIPSTSATMAPPDWVAAIRLTRADLPTLGLPRIVRRGSLEGGLKRRMGGLEGLLLVSTLSSSETRE